MKRGCSVADFLQAKRAHEPTIKRSVELWDMKTVMPREKARKFVSRLDGDEIAPDGRKFIDGSIPKFQQAAVRGKQ